MTQLFQGISEKNKVKLLYMFRANTFTFKKDTRILSTINDKNIIGFLISGYMQIIRTDYNGNVTIIEELEENSVFGTTISSLNNYEYEIITKEDVKMYIINYEEIMNAKNNETTYYNQFIKNLLEIITEKVIEKNERIAILSNKTIRDKLLQYFKIISEKNGSKIIYLNLNYSELANYLVVDRSAMSRELKNMREEGFIKCENKKITLLY